LLSEPLLELHRREHPEHGRVTLMTLDGDNTADRRAVARHLRQGGTVRVATPATPSGEQAWQRLCHEFPVPQVTRQRPERGSWNELLRERSGRRQEHEPRRGKEDARGR